MKFIVPFTYPRFSESIIQRAMLRRINDFEDVTVHDLHADYPDFMIEVEREQQLLLQNNVIILQHPFY